MSLENARVTAVCLQKTLSILVDEFATAQAPSWDDQGNLGFAVSESTPAIDAMADTLIELFEDELQTLKKGAQLDEIMSLLATRLDDETAKIGAEAATRLLYVIQQCDYGVFSDPDPGPEEPDIEGDATLLDEGLDAILARAPDDDDE